MTGLYVASNPQVIISQNQLGRNMAELTEVLTRLSTGLRINSGKDDPAGLIASELLKSDITATSKAISNAQRANSVIAIADSALGQVSNLLNDIKGLIVEAANSGAMTKDQIEANQLQVDASLDSIDRLSKSVNYQGKMLLDGSQSFQTMGVDGKAISDYTVHQANFGTADKIDVNVDVVKNAGRAQLIYNKSGISEDLVLEVGGNRGTDVFNFAKGTNVKDIAEAVNRTSDSTGVRAVVGQDATYGQLLATSAGYNNDINFTALQTGYNGGNYTIKYVAGNTNETTYTITEPSGNKPGVIEFQLKMDPWGNAAAEGLDEDFIGVKTSELLDGFIVQSKTGQEVKSFSIVTTTAAATQPSADFDAKTGHLQLLINVDPVTGLPTTTYEQLAEVIKENTGLEVVQYNDTDIDPTDGANVTYATGGDPVRFWGTDPTTGLINAAATPIGKTATTDVRANNALDITARVAGSQYDNTDVVFLQGPQAYNEIPASVVITSAEIGVASTANNSITFTAIPGRGADMNGFTFTFADLGDMTVPGTPAAKVDGKNITINSNGTNAPTKADIDAALAAVGITVTMPAMGSTAQFDTSAGGLANLVVGGIGANAVAGALEMTGGVDAYPGYSFDYTNNSSKAGVTVSNVASSTVPPVLPPPGAGVPTQAQYFRLTAKNGGSDYNEVGVEFVNTGANQPLSVVYDATAKMLRVYGGTDVATLGELKAAIEANSPFEADFFTDATLSTRAGLSDKMQFSNAASFQYDRVQNAFGLVNEIMTGQTAEDLGTNHQALIITVGQIPDGAGGFRDMTAQDIINAFETDPLFSKFSMKNTADSDGTGLVFWNSLTPGLYTDPAAFVHSGAMTGGTQGYETAVTAADLVDFVNNDAVLSQILHADLALNTPTGTGKLTLFDEYAYYGDPNAGTGLQFLGPKDSLDIIFASNLKPNGTKMPNQELAMWFTPPVEGFSKIDVPAKNPNAAISITAKNKGDAYDDMTVRYVRLGNDETESYVEYEEGPSAAIAYCSINDANSGTPLETGRFIITANDRGELYNNVNVVAKLDLNQRDAAVATFDPETGQLVISVNDLNVSLTDALAAINNEGTFNADYDFSYNHDTGATGPGNATFANILSPTKTSATIGNTGETGGHTGGTLTVYLAGDDPADPNMPNPDLSAQAVVDLINSDPVVGALFSATNYGSSDGSGQISFRDDNLTTITDGSGQQVIVPAATSSGGITQPSQMVIQLATDEYGNYITTAKQLADFFDQLSPEQTRGISVSVARPDGVDNLNRRWIDDGCGNITEVRDCEDNYGNGVLNPTYGLDDCGQLTYEVIEFTSFGSNMVDAYANDSVVTVGGWESMFTVKAKTLGPQYEGVSLVYERITDVDEAPSVTYDETAKQLVVKIHDGVTTAAEVKALIEGDKVTGGLFSIELKRDGAEAVTVTDDSLNTKYGTYEAGYRGGARMRGAADADPHSLTFESVDEGSDQTISVKSKNGAAFDLVNTDGKTADKATGTDMQARINGIPATAQGRALSIDTTGLKLTVTMGNDVKDGDSTSFEITGGGMMFQVGPDVVSNQQIRLGLMSVNTANLGGINGRLYQLRSGNNADLVTSDETRKLADLIVNDAIKAVAMMRGRLGTLQKSTFEPTIAMLQDSMESLTAAEAQISNADFAEESSKLTRAQILIQSGMQTLSIANQLPQYAAQLIGG